MTSDFVEDLFTLEQTLACVDPVQLDDYEGYTTHVTLLLDETRSAQDHKGISKVQLPLENFVSDCRKALDRVAHECAQNGAKCQFWLSRLWALAWTMLNQPRDTISSTGKLQHKGKWQWRYVRNNTVNHLEKIIRARQEMRDTIISVAAPELINRWRELFADIAFGMEDTLNPYIRHYLGMPLPDTWTQYLPRPNKWNSNEHYSSQGTLEDPLDERILVSLPETLNIWHR